MLLYNYYLSVQFCELSLYKVINVTIKPKCFINCPFYLDTFLFQLFDYNNISTVFEKYSVRKIEIKYV